MNQHQQQVLKFAFQKHWRKHSLKYFGMLICCAAFYFWNMAREAVNAPYQIVILDESSDQLILEPNSDQLQVGTKNAEDIYLIAEKSARPTGGISAFNQYIVQHINYPNEAYSKGISGKVFASFVVEKDGTISQIKIVKGIGGGCNEEVIRLMENSPKWIPASHKGELVRQRLIFPVQFGKKG